MEFRLPDVGEGMHEAEIVRWLVHEGERVREFDPMVEIQTDKAVVELPAPVTGYIQDIKTEPGQIVRVGDVLVVIQSQKSSVAIKANEATQTLDTEQPDLEIRTSPTGFHPNSLLQSSTMNLSTKPRATPAVRYYARQMRVSLDGVQGSGRGGRVLKEDIDRILESGKAPGQSRQIHPIHPGSQSVGGSPLLRALQPLMWNTATQPSATTQNVEADTLRRPVYDTPDSKLDPRLTRSSTKVPFRGIRRATAEHVKRSAFTAPHVTAFDECDAGELVNLRNRWNEALESRGQRISFLPFLMKAVVSGLQAFPYFNARLDEDEQVIELLPEYHIGVAMDTSDGLLVPVVRHADLLSLREIGEEIYRLTQGAKQRTLKQEELRGSTFTVTNTGPLGGMFATPILNYPEVGILGIHQIQRKPVVRDEEIVIRDMLTLSLSFDHRVIDGATAVRFMNHLKSVIEQPQLLMLELR